MYVNSGRIKQSERIYRFGKISLEEQKEEIDLANGSFTTGRGDLRLGYPLKMPKQCSKYHIQEITIEKIMLTMFLS